MKKNDKKGKRGQRADGRFQKSKRINGMRIYGYGYTVKEAEEDLRKKVAEAESGVLPDAKKLTVKQYFEEYLARRELDLRANTSYQWSSVVRCHIIPLLGHIQLRDLDQRHVQAWVTKLSKSGLKASSVHSYYTALRVAMNDAAKSKLIAQSPCQLITLPTKKKPERSILSPEQLRALLDVLEYPWSGFFILAFSTGMRKGELLSLRWDDIDFKAGALRVSRNISEIPTDERGSPEFIEDEPKSESSNRTIVLPTFALKALEEHRHKQKLARVAAGPTWKDRGVVFCRDDGDFMRKKAPNYALNAALKRAGLEDADATPHSGRHTLASQLLGRKINPTIVQEILGHSNIQMTLGMYSHALPTAHEEAMQLMDNVLWQKKEAN
jgi:integrase